MLSENQARTMISSMIKDMPSKICTKCDERKPLEGFHRDKKAANGRRGDCKECHRLTKRAHDRALRKAPIDERMERSRKNRKYERRYAAKNSIKRKAKGDLRRAVKRGDIVKPLACAECRKTSRKIEAHHPNYAKWRDVMWLCRQCHNDWHNKHGPGINGEDPSNA